ncbi:uncharacterized protein K02A2.6-like [Uranotaenia lowii]|uniref:uncharacterized protein K02A2.6-like n=1 Tax=Uranotaenia lowii TaxID=190385 RepID=UPI00247AEC64|nr:uncharacterized protein K02A2.6-like [Uranotaenia lowii]
MAEQNARLMAVMEQFNNQEAPVRPASGPEFIIESLASNIKEFCYDPENGLVFDRWFQKYEDMFLKDGENLDDEAKVHLLLRSLSINVHDKYVNFILSIHPLEFSFADTVTKLKQLFGVQISLFNKRFQCFQLTKHGEDDYVTYAGIVNKRCENFELNKITADQFESLIFICGLQSPRESDIRTRLLSKLESEGKGECKLESLITECQRLHNLKSDTAVLEQKQPTTASICAIDRKKQSYQPASSPREPSSVPKSPCWQCGDMHFVRDCSFSNHTCKVCNETSHKEGYCNCFSAKPKQKNRNRRKNSNQKSTEFLLSTVEAAQRQESS